MRIKMELPMLIKQCLTYEIEILPFELNVILRQYEINKIPDRELLQLDKVQIKSYLKGLYLCGQEMANDWTRGLEILKDLGFIEKIRETGHRQFTSLIYQIN